MLHALVEKTKYIAFTLRFSILSIFVTFFLIAMITLILFTYNRFTDSMAMISFNLMKQVSSTAFHQIENEMRHTELKCKSAAHLFAENVINTDKLSSVLDYITNFMQNEQPLFPSVQSVFWGDESGSFVMSEKQKNGTIASEMIDRSIMPPRRILINRDRFGNVIKTEVSNDLSYDPRVRPWYKAAKHFQHETWLDVYPYRITRYLGISVATPVYKGKGQLNGVINFNVRLDYLRHLIGNIHLSKHGVIFIVTTNGEVLAYPHLEQYQNTSLIKVDALSEEPWVVESFNYYKQTGNREFRFKYGNDLYLATYQPVSHYGSTTWLIGAVAPVNDFTGTLHQTQILTALVSLVILLLGITFVSYLITAVVRPLKKITHEIGKIKNFELNDSDPINSRIKEVSYIAEALYAMKKGLRSFQKYVPATLVRQLIESGEDARVGGVKKPIAILFSDIANFTTITEQIEPELLTRHICEYFDELSSIIITARGTIDKYIGDAIMAFWGAPLPEEFPERQAAIAAIHCVKRLRELNIKWAAEGKPVLNTRIGIHVGDAIVGNLGSTERLNYTAIGDSINIASRLESINKIYGTQIIISDTVYHAIRDQFPTRMLDCVTLKGKSEHRYIYELMADDRQQLNFDIDRYNQIFASAFKAYQSQVWDEAIQLFQECLLVYPDDSVAQLFIRRCEKFKLNPLSEPWKGVWAISEK